MESPVIEKMMLYGRGLYEHDKEWPYFYKEAYGGKGPINLVYERLNVRQPEIYVSRTDGKLHSLNFSKVKKEDRCFLFVPNTLRDKVHITLLYVDNRKRSISLFDPMRPTSERQKFQYGNLFRSKLSLAYSVDFTLESQTIQQRGEAFCQWYCTLYAIQRWKGSTHEEATEELVKHRDDGTLHDSVRELMLLFLQKSCEIVRSGL